MSDSPRDARWSEGADPELPGELSELLRGARAPLGTADEVAELARRLSAVLGPASGLSSGGQPAPSSGTNPIVGGGASGLGAASRGLWTIAGAGAAIALGVAVWLVASGTREPIAPSAPEGVPASVDVAPVGTIAPTVSGPVEAPAVAPPSSPAASTPLPAPAAPADRAQSASDDHSRVASPASRAKARASSARRAERLGPSETALLEQARAALRSRPARALELTQRHRAQFPGGALAEEREVIAIEALERLGRKDAARARSAEFERRYRGSVHQPRLLREADTSAPADGALNTAPR